MVLQTGFSSKSVVQFFEKKIKLEKTLENSRFFWHNKGVTGEIFGLPPDSFILLENSQ